MTTKRCLNDSVTVPYKIVNNLTDTVLILETPKPNPSCRTNFYQQLQPMEGEHPVASQVRSRLENDEGYRALWRRILGLSEELGRHIGGRPLEVWLKLEEALHEHAARISEEHYNQGVEDGRSVHALSVLSGGRDEPPPFVPMATQLRLMAKILSQIAQRVGKLEQGM